MLLSVFAALAALVTIAASARAAVDIGPMTWTQRSDWINVKSCHALTGGPNAAGNGVTDDTAAIQAVFNYLQNHSQDGPAPRYMTVYFPAGTYKISSTLRLASQVQVGMVGVSLIGCGSKTIIQWASTAPIGPAMFAPNGTDYMRYIGFVWDGNSRAGCGIEHNTTPNVGDGVPTYESPIRHENESFKNFTATGTYIAGESLPGAGIAQGFRTDINPPHTYNPTSEVSIYNCRFFNCTVGIGTTMSGAGNFYMWQVDGCEFDSCGTGIYFPGAGGYMVTNDHFQNSAKADLFGGLPHIRHCTSSGSAMFYTEWRGFASADVIEDCWVDRWTAPGPAINLAKLGPNTVFDCHFTHPPAGATGAIHNDAPPQPPLMTSLFLSNNSAPDFPGGYGIMDRSSVPAYHAVIPPGQRGGLVSSPKQTFLQTTWPADSARIIDVTQSPYNAANHGGTDQTVAKTTTAAIQAAINAARAANNGSVVYFPAGTYPVNSTLTASGGNYTLQGTGVRSSLRWLGGSSPTLAISNPQRIVVQGLNFSNPTSDVTVTATGSSSISLDDVHGLYVPNGDNSYRGSMAGQGLVLSNLPSGSTVSLERVDMPLTVVNCGPAQILAKFLEFSAINISGTAPKTGFLGADIAEGGQNFPGSYNITVNDNLDLVVGDYYTEVRNNDLDLERGSGTGTGHVTIQGINSASKSSSQAPNIVLANNYAGRLFYGSQQFANYNNGTPKLWPINMTQTGANALDMLFVGDIFSPSAPTFTLGSGANVALTDGILQDEHNNCSPLFGSPKPLTTANLASMASSLDDFRQLETADAAQQTGLVGYWKLDEPAGTVSRDSTISGLDGTWMNGPTFTADHPAAIGLTDPGGLSLNGVNQYVSIPSSAMLPSGRAPRTLCGWAKANNVSSSYRCLASFGSPSTAHAMFLGMHGKALWAGGYGSDFSVPNFWDNRWHFIALTYDGATARLYADGVLRASATKTWNLVPGQCKIGEQVGSGAQYWNGLIDDVRIYNWALLPEDIASLAGK